MDDFQQDFMRKVKNPTVEGEVINSSGAPKKPIDKRWFIIGALILILIVVFIVLLIISNSNKSPQPQGDPISTEKITSVTWTCNDNSTLVFDVDKNVIWTDNVGVMHGTYTVNGDVLSFGGVTGTINNNTLTLVTTELRRTITCQKESS